MTTSQNDSSSSGNAAGPLPLVDVDRFVDNYSDLKDVVPAILKSFLSNVPKNVEKIRVALEKSDADALKAAAHSFKGSLLQMYAMKPGDLAMQLEYKGREKTVEGAEELFQSLLALLPALEAELNSIVQTKINI